MSNETNDNINVRTPDETIEPKKTIEKTPTKESKISLDFVSAIIGASLAAVVAFLLTTLAEPALTHKSLEENVRVSTWKTDSTLSIFVENDSSDTLDIVKFNLQIPFTRTSLGAAMTPEQVYSCLLYTSPSPRDATLSRMPSSA